MGTDPALESRGLGTPAAGRLVTTGVRGLCLRDVYRLYDARLAQMLNEDSLTFVNWNQDEAAIKERYKEQDPEVVADELEAAAQRLVAWIQSLKPEQYRRRGSGLMALNSRSRRSFSTSWHDVIHHLWDVTGQQDAAASLVLE